MGTPAAVPGIKVIKPPRLWGLVLGDVLCKGTDAFLGDGCSARGRMLYSGWMLCQTALPCS